MLHNTNDNKQKAKEKKILWVKRRIEGVVIAGQYCLLEFNVFRKQLPRAEKIVPGFESPTVSALEDKNWCAVKVMVKSSEVHEKMDELEKLGATAIFQTSIKNCRL